MHNNSQTLLVGNHVMMCTNGSDYHPLVKSLMTACWQTFLRTKSKYQLQLPKNCTQTRGEVNNPALCCSLMGSVSREGWTHLNRLFQDMFGLSTTYRRETPITPSSTWLGLDLMISRSWQYISCHWDACSNHLASSTLVYWLWLSSLSRTLDIPAVIIPVLLPDSE